MPIEKQSLNNFLPDGFETLNQEGYKENFNEDKIKTGYEKDVPDIVSGPNLNNLIDVVGKNTNTLNSYVEYLNGMPINNVPTTDENGQLNYINLDDKLTKKQITNCILEIPQRIKYTLENGTLTIKAGSVVIVPYGVEDLTAQYPVGSVFINNNFRVYDTQFEDGKFFVWAEVQSDIINNQTTTSTEKRVAYIDMNDGGVWSIANSESGANDTASVPFTLYYNTTTNFIGSATSTTAINYGQGRSLPLFISSSNGTVMFDLINQVFNGIGYIGSTVWVDKGVKGLIPNGRNEDGSLNNIEVSNTKILIQPSFGVDTLNPYWFIWCDFGVSNASARFRNSLAPCQYFQNEKPILRTNNTYAVWFSPNENILRFTNDGGITWVKNEFCLIGSYKCADSKIIEFDIKTTFKALDFNDKSEISSFGMPSAKYIELTRGASGTRYIAPANGYFMQYGKFGSQVGYVLLDNLKKLVSQSYGGNNINSHVFIPVKKGEEIVVTYANTTGGAVYFIYAEGEV